MAEEGGIRQLLGRIALLFPGISVSVIPVPLPKAETIVIEEHETADPFRTFPCVEMRDNQTERTTMVGSKRFPVMFEGEQNVWAL